MSRSSITPGTAWSSPATTCSPRSTRRSPASRGRLAARSRSASFSRRWDRRRTRSFCWTHAATIPFPQCASRGTPSGNGFRGLQRVSASDTSLIIANATLSGQLAADGDPGAHSPFATALLSRFDADGSAPLRDMLDRTARDVRNATGGTQVPEISTQGGAPEICLNPECSQSVASNQSSSTTTQPQATTGAGDDKGAYEAAIAVGSCGALQAFVSAYPSSFYASLARERAAQACAPQQQALASSRRRSRTTVAMKGSSFRIQTSAG